MKKMFLLILVTIFIQTTFAQMITESDNPPLDGIVDRSTLNTMNALPYPPSRAADILWEKRI